MFVPQDLPWLPEPPADFRAACRALEPGMPALGEALRMLATHRLRSAEQAAFAKALRRLRGEGAALDPLSPFRLAILPAATFDLVADALPAAAARHGIALDLKLAEFDQIAQVALGQADEVFAEAPDAVLVQFDHRWLALDRFAPEGGAGADEALARVAAILDGIREAVPAQLIVTNLATPPNALFGSFDAVVSGSVRARVQRFNAGLPAVARERGALILDVAATAELVGTAHWFDAVQWNVYKLPFASDCAPLFAEALARMIGALRGKARKCLVLDLDNTLWGGVIGDDGIDGIRIGADGGEGEAFLAVQQLAQDLKRRGIILAVCSKNFDETAREPFRAHRDMILRESDIAVFQANWSDKPTNLEAIAETLAIGLDSLVFLDDNGAERAQVRAALPMVAVPELPADPSLYPAYLACAGYFEAVAYSDEDGSRAETYAANAQRAEIRAKVRDLGDYLRELEMRFSAQRFDAAGRARIAQLINKSNQFNLTTRRYTEAEVQRFEEDSRHLTLQVRLADKFSDFGMIGVVIARLSASDPDAVEIDSWLMSCRVLGRRVEEAMLQALVGMAERAGRSRILAEYLPTAKNAMVADLFDRLGFERVAEEADGARRYALRTAAHSAPDLPFAEALFG